MYLFKAYFTALLKCGEAKRLARTATAMGRGAALMEVLSSVPNDCPWLRIPRYPELDQENHDLLVGGQNPVNKWTVWRTTTTFRNRLGSTLDLCEHNVKFPLITTSQNCTHVTSIPIWINVKTPLGAFVVSAIYYFACSCSLVMRYAVSHSA